MTRAQIDTENQVRAIVARFVDVLVTYQVPLDIAVGAIEMTGQIVTHEIMNRGAEIAKH